MTSAINPNLITQRSAPQAFNEGAGANVARITAIVVSILAALSSFLFLPVEGALLVSAGIGALLSMLCCCSSGGSSSSRLIPSINIPAIARAVNFGATHHVRVLNDEFHRQPVLNVGPRAQVGGGHRPPYNGIQVMPYNVPLAARAMPAVYNAQPVVPAAAFADFNMNNNRVPVGRGHN